MGITIASVKRLENTAQLANFSFDIQEITLTKMTVFYLLVKKLTEKQQECRCTDLKMKIEHEAHTSKFSLTSCIIFNFVSSAVNGKTNQWVIEIMFTMFLKLLDLIN